MSNQRVRILVADDDWLMLAAVSKLLRADFDVVGTVQDGRALIEAAIHLRPDLIVTDISMPKLNGIAAARKIHDRLPGVKVIFLTMQDTNGYRREAFSLGAAAYILKSSAGEQLNQAVHDALMR